MSTFLGQLIGFAVILLLVWRYVVPPLRKLMPDQQNAVRQQLADSAAAADRLAEASRAHEKAKEDAKAEAKRITEEAQSDATRIVEQFLDALDAMAPSEADVEYPVAANMRSTSRTALGDLLKAFGETAESHDD